MGGLIQTKGTKLLSAHFRDEFSTWIDFYRLPAHVVYFNTAAAGCIRGHGRSVVCDQ